MIAVSISSIPARAATPEALDAEFLDYLAACEDESGNWTEVADEKAREKADEGGEQKPAPAPGKDASSEEVRP
jgi:hypothetical protein